VDALPLPGFLAGEPVPESLDAVTGLVAAAATDRTVLLGYSSGGLLAAAAAHRLAAAGTPPAALVLLDSGPLPAGEPLSRAVLSGLADRLDRGVGADDTRLTAMGAHLRLLAGWAPSRVDVPTLVVRAGAEPDRWRWPFRHDGVEVPGDHFAVLEESAAEVAEHVNQWLEELWR